MNIAIAGASDIGFHLAKLLSFEAQDITIIDADKELLNYADNNLDLLAVKGDPSALATLKLAGVDQADMMIAVTSSETTNLMCCLLAKQLGCKQTIARVTDIDFEKYKNDVDFKSLGIDELVSPEELAAEEIQLLIHQSAFENSHEFEDGALTMMGTTLEDDAPFVGKTVREAAAVFPGVHFMPIAIKRIESHNTIIPRGDTCFQKGDQVYFTTLPQGVSELYSLTGEVKNKIKNVMILGRGIKVKLIELDKERAIDMAERLPNTLIIHGDGRNVELLLEENLDEMDAFLGVTNDAETNIMSCLMAKSKQVPKIIALIENMDYFDLTKSIGVDTLVNKKMLTANTIFRYIRRGEVVDLAKLNNMDAEIVEFKVKPFAKVIGKAIKNLDFPKTATIGGVIRNGAGVIALGDFVIEESDLVLVCCLPQSIRRVEQLFL
jgi:trk system potassium uptake protein TrkA